MKAIYLNIFIGGLLLIMESGCVKKALDVDPIGTYTTATYWRNQDDAITGINGIYNILTEEDGVGHGYYCYDDQSDDISVDGDHPDMIAITTFTEDPTAYQLEPNWSWSYEEIERANNALIYIPRIPVMDPDIRNRCMGEAYFLRAFGYWMLNQLYGSVPLILEQNEETADYNVPKSDIDSVRSRIESDLLKAADLLPETYDASNKGRVTKGSAWGLLCKLYMTWDKLDQALVYGEKIVNDPNYALAPDYRDNFTLGSQQDNSTELLFAVWNKNNYNNSPINIYFTPRAWNGWGFHHPTQDFVSEFEPADSIRKRATVLAVGDSIPYQTTLIQITDKDAYQVFSGMQGQYTGRMLPSNSTTGYCIRKYTAYNPDNSGNLDGDLKQPLLRSADIYLLVAEAKIRLSGAGAGDAEINAVRSRAGLPPVSNAGIPELIHERRVELGGENVRWQDLLRWDKDGLVNLDTIVSKPKLASPLPPYNSAVIVPPRTFVRPKDYYVPIPQVVIDESKGVITQNR